jgi:hypothetical protein
VELNQGYYSLMKLGMNCNAKGTAILVGALSCLLSNSEAQAANKSSTMNVSLKVVTGCGISVSNMSFGTVNTVTNQTATSNVIVTCNRGTFIQLSFTAAPSAGQPTLTAKMTNLAGNKIGYTVTLAGWQGTIGNTTYGYTTMTGQVAPTPGAPNGYYQDTEALYVIY